MKTPYCGSTSHVSLSPVYHKYAVTSHPSSKWERVYSHEAVDIWINKVMNSHYKLFWIQKSSFYGKHYGLKLQPLRAHFIMSEQLIILETTPKNLRVPKLCQRTLRPWWSQNNSYWYSSAVQCLLYANASNLVWISYTPCKSSRGRAIFSKGSQLAEYCWIYIPSTYLRTDLPQIWKFLIG